MTVLNTQIAETINITENGQYDVARYTTANVSTPVAPTYYVKKVKDTNNILQNANTIIDLTGVIDVGANVLAYDYYYASFPANTSVNFRSLTTLSGNFACQYMFSYAQNITSADLGNLTTISGNNACQSMFSSCTSITSADLGNLTTISGNNACQGMFNGCSALTNVNIGNLQSVSGTTSVNGMFTNTGIIEIIMNKLSILSSSLGESYAPLLGGCSKLASVQLGGLKASTFSSRVNQLRYLFNGTTGSQATGGCTIHFPSNFDPSDPNHTFDASTLSGYPTFGGSASYIHVAFDLPATE